MTAEVHDPAPLRGVLSIPDPRTGHTEISWDPRNPGEVEVARAAFDAAVKDKKMRVYRKGDGPGGTSGDLLKEFDPRAGEYVIFEQTVGG